MSRHGSMRATRRGVAIACVILVAVSAAGCSSRTSHSVSVGQLAGGEIGHGAVKVEGLISSEPTSSGEGTVFFIQDDMDASKQVAVVYNTRELPPIPADRGAKGYVDRLVIVTGTFDGRVIESEDLILKRYGGYGL